MKIRTMWIAVLCASTASAHPPTAAEIEHWQKAVATIPDNNDKTDVDLLRAVIQDAQYTPETTGFSPHDLKLLRAIGASEDAYFVNQERNNARRICRDIAGLTEEQIDTAKIVADWQAQDATIQDRWLKHAEAIQQQLSPAGLARLEELEQRKATDGSFSVAHTDMAALAAADPNLFANMLISNCTHPDGFVPGPNANDAVGFGGRR